MILALVMALALVACGNKNTDDGKKDNPDDNKTPTVITNPDKVQDEMTSSDGKYEVAFVTDVGQLKDKSFNQGTYDGVKLYAANNGLSYKYYQPANGSEATDDDRFTAMKAAVDNGAKVVVCAGFMQTNALRMAASQFTDVSFVYIDGDVIRADAEDKNSAILTNVAGVAWRRRQPRLLPLRLWLRAGRRCRCQGAEREGRDELLLAVWCQLLRFPRAADHGRRLVSGWH